EALDTNYPLHPKALDSLRFINAEEFPADVFYDLLTQTNPKQGQAKGIRIYLRRDPNGQMRMVLVPADSLGNDIINHLVNLKVNPAATHARAAQADDGN